MDDETHNELSKIAQHLSHHEVDYVIIGGWSIDASFPELGYRTQDIDFIIATTDENYERIAVTLNEMGVRETRGGIPMRDTATFTAAKLRSKPHWRLYAEHGVFDLMVDAAAIGGYEQASRRATEMSLGDSGVTCKIADPAMVLASKTMAGRDKDNKIIGALAEAIKQKAKRNRWWRRRRYRASSTPTTTETPSHNTAEPESTEDIAARIAEQISANTARCVHVGKRSRKRCTRPPHSDDRHEY